MYCFEGRRRTVRYVRADASARLRFRQGTGVYFRATTRDTAREYDVDGWVRNLDDGRVEAAFESSEEDVEAMVEFCHEGSPAARVDDVDVTYEKPQGEDGFEIRR